MGIEKYLSVVHHLSLLTNFSLLTNTLLGPSASEVTTLWRCRNLVIISIILLLL